MTQKLAENLAYRVRTRKQVGDGADVGENDGNGVGIDVGLGIRTV